jgi:hypothetical protein
MKKAYLLPQDMSKRRSLELEWLLECNVSIIVLLTANCSHSQVWKPSINFAFIMPYASIQTQRLSGHYIGFPGYLMRWIGASISWRRANPYREGR